VIDLDDFKGPVLTTVADAKKENKALLRELGRTQTINRDLTFERNTDFQRSGMTTPLLRDKDETSNKRLASSVQSRRPVLKRR